jgi:hypothetical protein
LLCLEAETGSPLLLRRDAVVADEILGIRGVHEFSCFVKGNPRDAGRFRAAARARWRRDAACGTPSVSAAFAAPIPAPRASGNIDAACGTASDVMALAASRASARPDWALRPGLMRPWIISTSRGARSRSRGTPGGRRSMHPPHHAGGGGKWIAAPAYMHLPSKSHDLPAPPSEKNLTFGSATPRNPNPPTHSPSKSATGCLAGLMRRSRARFLSWRL